MFTTKIYHPQVSSEGKVCLEILSKSYTPAVTIESVLNNLIILLQEPSADDGIQPNIAAQVKNNYEEYRKTASEWTQRHASHFEEDE